MKWLVLLPILSAGPVFSAEQVDQEIIKNFEFFSQSKVVAHLGLMMKFEAVKLFRSQNQKKDDKPNEQKHK